MLTFITAQYDIRILQQSKIIKAKLRIMRLTKRCQNIKMVSKATEMQQSYHNKLSMKSKERRLDYQVNDNYSERYSNNNFKFKKALTKQKTNKILEDILKRGDSKRKMFYQQHIPYFKNKFQSFRCSQVTETIFSYKQKQNRKQLLRQSMSEKPKKTIKVNQRKQKQLSTNFERLLKEIKQKNYIRVDDQNQILKLKFQAFGSTLKGQKHNVNQDAMIFSQGIYIICDGHGANGKQISEFVSQITYKFIKEAISEGKIDIEILKHIMKKTQSQLDLSGIDIAFSGSTFIGIIIYENLIFCISVGDSRAILNQGLNIKQLGVIHKPDKKTQKDRIERCGGVIRPFQVGKDKYVGPNRIWAPGKSSWGPGLALSRAFGDKASRKYGVISEAQIIQYNICYDINFIVLGSDGLFDFMKQTQISFFIRKKLKDIMFNRDYICDELIAEARKMCQTQSDDITCIIILF